MTRLGVWRRDFPATGPQGPRPATRVVHVYGPQPWDAYIGRPMRTWGPVQGAPDWLWDGGQDPWRIKAVHEGHPLANPFRAKEAWSVAHRPCFTPTEGARRPGRETMAGDMMARATGVLYAATVEDAIELYRMWVAGSPWLWHHLAPLRGKTLACWCKACAPFSKHKTDQPCHGDVLARLLEET